MSDPIWRGTDDITAGKVHVAYSTEKIVANTDYVGPFADLLTSGPRPGDVNEIEGFDMRVTEAKLTETDGGSGRLDVTLEVTLDQSTYSTDPITEPVYEITYGELQRPIEAHPRCGRLKDTRPAIGNPPKKRTWEDWESLTSLDYDSAFTRVAGVTTWTLAEYQALKEKGIEEYTLPSPTLSRTLNYLYPPADLGTHSGKRQPPPTGFPFARLDDYEWLGGSDRCTKGPRSYTRTTEWMGADYWDPLLYTT